MTNRNRNAFGGLLVVLIAAFGAYGKSDLATRRPEDYAFKVGLNVGAALAGDNVSVYAGRITTETDSSAYLTITERIRDHSPGVVQLLLRKPKPRSHEFASTDLFPRLTVDYSKGTELIVFFDGHEKEDLSIVYAMSYKDLFEDVRKIIDHHTEVRENFDVLANTSKIIELSHNPVFRGYIARYVDMRSRNFPDSAALILSGLLKNYPSESTVYLRLSSFLGERTIYPIKQQTRDQVFQDVISVAVGRTRGAKGAIVVLIETTNKGGGDQLRRFLTPENKAELLRELKLLPPPDRTPPHQRTKFKALLLQEQN